MQKTTGSRPVPDPTELTTAIVNESKVDLRREIHDVKELLLSEVKNLKELHTQKFLDNMVAVDSALRATEKAVDKSETAFTKQLDEMSRTTGAVTGGMNKEIDDVKRRLGAIEGRSTGVGMSTSVMASSMTIGVAIVAVVVAIVLRGH